MKRAAPQSQKRTTIPGGRVTGKVVEWKGEFGWVQPSKPIDHPAASKRGGKVYLSQEDVVEELTGIGAMVSFIPYSDNSGIGASDCKMANSPSLKAAAKAGKATGKGSNAVAEYLANKKARTQSPAEKPAAKAASGKASPKGSNAVAEYLASKKTGGGGGGKGGGGKNGGGKGKDKGPGKREILSEEPMLGTICQWKGNFGWITPAEPIDHPLADKFRGDVYLAQEDVESEIDGEGATVQFILYQDRKGLGAANVNAA